MTPFFSHFSSSLFSMYPRTKTRDFSSPGRRVNLFSRAAIGDHPEAWENPIFPSVMEAGLSQPLKRPRNVALSES